MAHPTCRNIIDAVEQMYGTKIVERSRCQYRDRARFVAYYLCRQLTLMSYRAIANVFQRDHTSVLHGVQQAEEMLEREPIHTLAISELHAMLGETRC
jgi:chromosomal replication initiation ATPase DnaA